MTIYAYVLDGVCPAYGWQGGPSHNTEVEEQRSQQERRNAIGDEAVHYYHLPFENIADEDYERYLKSVHMVMYGRTHSFFVVDWLDHVGTLESLGLTPGANTNPVQLRKGYHILDRSGNIIASRWRDITKPDENTVHVFQDNGAGVFLEKTGTVDPLTGLFTPTTNWVAGRALKATFEFFVLVRFDNDDLPMSIASRNSEGFRISGSVTLREVFDEE